MAVPVVPAPDGSDQGPALGAGGREVVASLGLDLATSLARASATGAAGEVVSVPVVVAASPVEVVHLVGVGDRSPDALRRAGAAVARRMNGRRHLATSVAVGATADATRAFVEGLALATYSFSRKTGREPREPIGVDLVLRDPTARAEAVRRALVTARAAELSRDLANEPSNVKNPAWLARQAEVIGSEAGLAVVVRDERALAAEGFGGIIGVGQGSASPPRLIEMSYRPERSVVGSRRVPHVVLVGKGITFDTGGISIKPADAMTTMKTDMSGGGAVIAAMCALRDLDVPVRVTGLVAAAENMPSGTAQRPSDVLTQYGGTTVEVLNTDAEGRLVLADALAYADRRLDPDALVDLATLTGAASLGLGRRHAALYATDDRLAAGLAKASATSGERVWRMPLVEDYRSSLASSVADIAHIPTVKVGGGSITAALFLQAFVGDRPWVHLDIAGPARSDAEEHEVPKGPTGYGVRLLLRWLEAGAPGVRAS